MFREKPSKDLFGWRNFLLRKSQWRGFEIQITCLNQDKILLQSFKTEIKFINIEIRKSIKLGIAVLPLKVCLGRESFGLSLEILMILNTCYPES